jgi:hypothetical protein
MGTTNRVKQWKVVPTREVLSFYGSLWGHDETAMSRLASGNFQVLFSSLEYCHGPLPLGLPEQNCVVY